MPDINLNGRWIVVVGASMTYEEIVGLAMLSSSSIAAPRHAVSWHVSLDSGVLLPGARLVLQDKMVIDVAIVDE